MTSTDPELRRIEDALRDVRTDRRPPADWQARVWAGVAAEPPARRWLVWLAAPAALAVAAALAITFLPSPSPTGLRIELKSGDGVVRGPTGHPGDTLEASVDAESAQVELRVYHEDRLRLRCGDGEGCTRHDKTLTATFELLTPGRYLVATIRSSAPLPPLSGVLDTDLSAARRAGAEVELSETIDIW